MFGRQEGLFFARWLRNPLQTGAVMPSGSELAHLMAAQVDPGQAGMVVELGGGTGVITTALLDAGVAEDRLIVVEKDPELHQRLTARFPDLEVIRGDAAHLATHLHRLDVHSVDTVISGLPMLSISEPHQRRILRPAFDLLRPGGAFIQFTYGFGAPVALFKLAQWGIDARLLGRSWRNLPPASVWRLTHRRAQDRPSPSP